MQDCSLSQGSQVRMLSHSARRESCYKAHLRLWRHARLTGPAPHLVVVSRLLFRISKKSATGSLPRRRTTALMLLQKTKPARQDECDPCSATGVALK